MLGSIHVYKSFMDCLIAALFLTGRPSGRSRQRRSLHILNVSRHSIKHSHNLFLDPESWIFDFSFTTNTLPKTNIAPENRQSLRKFHLPTTDLQGCKILASGRISKMDSERSVQWNHPTKSSPQNQKFQNNGRHGDVVLPTRKGRSTCNQHDYLE